MKNIFLLILFVFIFGLWIFYYLFQTPERRKNLLELMSDQNIPTQALLIIRYIDDEYIFETHELESHTTLSVDLLLQEEIIISLNEDEKWTLINQTHPLTLQHYKTENIQHINRMHFCFIAKQSGQSIMTYETTLYGTLNVEFNIH